MLVLVSLTTGIKDGNASPFHPRRTNRSIYRFSFSRALRNRRYDSLSISDGAHASGNQVPPTEKYVALNFSFGSTPLLVFEASPHASFIYNYANMSGNYQYNSTTHWSTWNQPAVTGAFNLEFGKRSGFFWGLGMRFSGGVGSTVSENLEFGYNFSITAKPKWKIRPSISFTHTATRVWFPDQIDNHEKDAILFGETFRYAVNHCGRYSCSWTYSDYIDVGVRNLAYGMILKLGIDRDLTKTISCQLNLGYNIYFNNTLQVYANSKNDSKGIALNTPGLTFTGVSNPDHTFNYNGFFAEATLSIRFTRGGRHHYSRHRY